MTRLWPDTLPGPTADGYELTIIDQALRTDMEVGTRRARRVTFVERDDFSAAWRFSDVEMQAFRAWHADRAWSLLGNSDDLTAWTTFGATISADAVVGPKIILADLIAETADTSSHRARRDFDAGFVAGGTAVVTVSLRSLDRTHARVLIRDTDAVDATCVIDLTNGSIVSTSGVTLSSIERRSGDWYRVTLELPTGSNTAPVADAPFLQIQSMIDANTTLFAGDPAKGVYVCEVNARMKDVSNLYLPTDSAGNVRGAGGGAGWFLVDLPVGGGLRRVEAQFITAPSQAILGGFNFQVAAQLEVRHA